MTEKMTPFLSVLPDDCRVRVDPIFPDPPLYPMHVSLGGPTPRWSDDGIALMIGEEPSPWYRTALRRLYKAYRALWGDFD